MNTEIEPMLAGDPKCDETILAELAAAGIRVVVSEHSKGEVPYNLTGVLHGWTFHRAWYYWVCKTAVLPLPMAAAMVLHEAHGKVVRVDGSCVCPAPDKHWGWNGFAGSYHVDSVEGLRALADAIRAHAANVGIFIVPQHAELTSGKGETT